MEAHMRTELKGSCTATLASLHGERLCVANIGDSGFVVVRGGEIVAQSLPMHHGFDLPFHIGHDAGDEPSCAMEYCVDVQPGDALVLGTDGLFDNLFSGELTAAVASGIHDRLSPEVLAKKLVTAAFKKSQTPGCPTPFSEAARCAGRRLTGGKVDDITALVAIVC